MEDSGKGLWRGCRINLEKAAFDARNCYRGACDLSGRSGGSLGKAQKEGFQTLTLISPKLG